MENTFNFTEAMELLFNGSVIQIVGHDISYFKANERNTTVESYYTNGVLNTKEVIITQFIINSRFKIYDRKHQ